MTDIRDHALHCEVKKHAYRQTQDGVVLSLVLHPQEVPDGLATSPLGTRYMIALVEIGDDEKPVKQSAAAQPERKDSVSTARAKPKQDWIELLPQTQAAIRAQENAFATFLKESYPDEWHETSDANECLKLICSVSSKRELATNHKARMLWRALDDKFEAWKRVA